MTIYSQHTIIHIHLRSLCHDNNRELLHKIKTKPPLIFTRIAGALETTTTGVVRDLGNAYFQKLSSANIISFSQLREQGHQIKFKQRCNTDTFIISTPNYEYHLKDRGAGLYVCDLTPTSTAHVTTVEDNAALHSKREVGQALAARELQEQMAHPPDNKLAQALSHGNIIYGKVSPADTIRAQSICGPLPKLCRDAPHTGLRSLSPLHKIH